MDLPTREQLVHALYEAAELEHNLMCTYLYAAFSLKTGEADGLSATEADAAARWRRTILKVAVEEMGHLTAVWNITSALGGAPRFGRGNFPLDPGVLPASVVVKLAPFSEEVVQHFVHLERPRDSSEPEGEGFAPDFVFSRSVSHQRLTPMAIDYETIGAFYARLETGLKLFGSHHGDSVAFCGDPALQLTANEVELVGANKVVCLKTALEALAAIVEQGEGAPGHSQNSHFQRFHEIREELAALKRANPGFEPAFPAARNPVLRPPLRREGRVWIENEAAAQTVDLANSAYGLMLRLIAFSYLIPRPSPEKRLAIDLALGLMRAVTHLAERAARLPAGPSNPNCNAGVSFIALREAGSLPPGASSHRFFIERFEQLLAHAEGLDAADPRIQSATRILGDLAKRAQRGFAIAPPVTAPAPAPVAQPTVATGGPRRSAALAVVPPTPTTRDGVDYIEGEKMTLIYEGKRCIHSRYCVTWAPTVFLANVVGPWIHPDAIDVEALAEIAHVCPSAAIRYKRKDGRPDEQAPAVNLIAIREAGPYAVRGDLRIDGAPANFRATLCRCGASKNKPYCDSSHHTIEFAATGEPPTQGNTDMLEARDGPLDIDLQIDGPYRVRGNLEITSGTGRVVSRVTQANLCRCGASNTKPFCDGSHQRIGFRSDR